MITPVHYRVGDEIIYNSILAKFRSYQTGKSTSFYCNDLANDQLDWTTDPELTIDQLMDQYARQLRANYDYIVLTYSGGTDSKTIYDVFVRNNLHIDEIVVWVDELFETYFSKLALTDLIAKHKDTDTIIRSIDRFNLAELKRTVTNENWILENRSTIVKTGANMYDCIVRDCQEKCTGTWCVINGHEQPNVYIQDGYYYSCFPSIRFHSTMGFDNVIPFFIEPWIALKQAHLMKNTYSHLMKVGRYSEEHSRQFYNFFGAGMVDGKPIHYRSHSKLAYAAWQKSIGRTGDLYFGYSYDQKGRESKFDSRQAINLETIDHKELAADVDQGLAALLSQNDDTALVFQKGIRNILLERNFCKDMLDNGRTTNILGKSNSRPIYSKSYCLGKVVL
jgi:hypothetical protein